MDKQQEQIYRIAGMTVGFQPLTDTLCDGRLLDFRAEGRPDFTIRITPADMEREAVEFAKVDRRLNRSLDRPASLLEFIAFHRKLNEKAPFYRVFSFHGSAVAMDGEAYLFTARSGTGKSTHTRLWREAFGDRAVMVNDDKPMLRVTEQETLVCGTPWNGKHKLGSNIDMPLKAICFLERSEQNWIREAEKGEILPRLFPQILRPDDPAAVARIMEMLDSMHVRYYRLGCNMDPEAARISYEGMQ